LAGDSRLGATVEGWLQMTQASRPSIEVVSLNAHGLPGCGSVVVGTTRGHSVGCHADNAMGERARNIGVPRTWQAIVGRLMFAGRVLWTGKHPLNSGRQSRPESRRLRDGQVKSMPFTLVLA